MQRPKESARQRALGQGRGQALGGQTLSKAQARLAREFPVAMSNARYEVVRSTRDPQLHIIFVMGRFADIPDRDRRLGPWRPLSSGNIADLKPHYRAQIAASGYVMVRQSAFSAEPRSRPRTPPPAGERTGRTGSVRTRPKSPR
jgi:hypothetical protein